MNKCPITYEDCGNEKYSLSGLHKLSARLKKLSDFPYTQEEQVRESAARAAKMSIQGVQPKLSVRLDEYLSVFKVVDTGGRFILKPQNPVFPELPENEDLTMRLARILGIEIPFHGLVYCIDGKLSYFIKRFDRIGKKNKLPVEDFAQLSGENRETKYNSSMEKVALIIDKYCTFPFIEKLKLFRLTIFNFLIGNEDMHLKNFSIINREGKCELSPAYDLLNTTIAQRSAPEEIALPINGKKRNLSRGLFFEYFGSERLQLNDKVLNELVANIKKSLHIWKELINGSFMSAGGKENYLKLLSSRIKRLEIE